MKVPLFHALTERIMIGGIPRKIAICGGTVAASLILGLQNIYVIPCVIVAYIVLALLYKLDAYFLEILAEHIKEDDHLHP
jgi:type IV secretory pathway TrbD component